VEELAAQRDTRRSIIFGGCRGCEPRIGAKFPLLEAAQANELLESGEASGKIVLLAPELLQNGS